MDRNNPSKLIPVIIAGGGGGMADISSDNNPDAITIFDDEKMKLLKEDMEVDGMIQQQLIKCRTITCMNQLDHLMVSQLNNTGQYLHKFKISC